MSTNSLHERTTGGIGAIAFILAVTAGFIISGIINPLVSLTFLIHGIGIGAGIFIALALSSIRLCIAIGITLLALFLVDRFLLSIPTTPYYGVLIIGSFLIKIGIDRLSDRADKVVKEMSSYKNHPYG